MKLPTLAQAHNLYKFYQLTIKGNKNAYVLDSSINWSQNDFTCASVICSYCPLALRDTLATDSVVVYDSEPSCYAYSTMAPFTTGLGITSNSEFLDAIHTYYPEILL